MPSPIDVYKNPSTYWSFITSPSDDKFEGQYFDRKEAGRVGDNGYVSKTDRNKVKNQIKECVSAFANANVKGGLLVLGVSKNGEVKGVSHLGEDQLNEITNFNQLLRNQAAIVKEYECQNSEGNSDKILLIYVPYADRSICETLKHPPEAWTRSGSQNILLDDLRRDQLKREKQIVDFERNYCCPFDIDDVDSDTLVEYRKSLNTYYEYEDERLLYEVGAIRKNQEGNLFFTNAGFLFFGRNPQRELSWAYIRLLRFEVNRDAENARQSSSLPEKKFGGPIAQQIRKIRAFFGESGFFKTYQKRNPDGGGFIDDPEFPSIAIDEAIVNAVAHRDYATQLPIECIHYKDAFVVENPGRVLQRDQDVPEEFSLDETELNSRPRNSILIEWLKNMRTDQGVAFVQALSEGTKRMQAEMEKADLPAPHYKTGHSRTVVTLYNNAKLREVLLQQAAQARATTEYSNLFPMTFITEGGRSLSPDGLRDRRKDFFCIFQRCANSQRLVH